MLDAASRTQLLNRLRGDTALRSRIAPTPSGYLHAGNGASFVLTWLLIRAAGGKLLLRIDDLDRQRRRPEYIEDIFRTLDWLKIDYDLGPTGPEDFLRHWSQEHRREAYTAALQTLWNAGQLYACDCSRRQVQDRYSDGLYRGYCRSRQLPATGTVAWRFPLPDSSVVTVQEATGQTATIDLAAAMGDFVVRRKNGQAAYQLASVVDDDHYEVSFVVRGADLLPSTAAQYLLAQCLPGSCFSDAAFLHHPLILDNAAEKLSKSAGSQALHSWRAVGRDPTDVYAIAKNWLGAPPRVAPQLSDLLGWLQTG